MQSHYVKSTEYISKDEAAAKLKEDLGEDFVNFLGYNPLSPTIDVYLFAGFTAPDSVAKIEKYIMEYPFVKEVYYQESLLYLINENVRKIINFYSGYKYIPFTYCIYNNKQYNPAFSLLKKISDQDNAACWSKQVFHTKAIPCKECTSWPYCRSDCNDTSYGTDLYG